MDARINEYLHQLALRGFVPHYVDTSAQAVDYLLSQIPQTYSLGFGGSTTITQLGLRDICRQRGNQVLFHSDTPREQWSELLPRIMNADAYICSANAISGDGRIWQVDGTGNRLSALCYGPSQIYLVCGINKLVDGGRTEAIARIKAIAAPQNCIRLNINSPCAQSAKCPYPDGRLSSRCICNLTLEMARAPGGRVVHVIIVGEELGF